MMTLTRLDAFKRNLIGHIVCCVTTAKETIEKLSSEKWDYVFLDHDLGGQTYVPSGSGTGYEVAQWISNNPDQKPEKVIIHKKEIPSADIRIKIEKMNSSECNTIDNTPKQ